MKNPEEKEQLFYELRELEDIEIELSVVKRTFKEEELKDLSGQEISFMYKLSNIEIS